MKFLPENYQAPKSSNNYMKLQDGENKIRILTAPILGWEDWAENKPIRYRFDSKPSKSNDPKKPVRHFWAFIVWNYNEEKIQILQLTQATIRNNIEALDKDEDWGQPFFYDLKIIRKGEGVDTEYMVNPLPHKDLLPSIREEFASHPCNLEALFDNGDPFAPEWANNPTPGVFEKAQEVQAIPAIISKDQCMELEDIIAGCSAEYKKSLFAFLSKQNVSRISELPLTLHKRVKDAVVKKKAEHEEAQTLAEAI
jgi:hypothetical protein